MSMAAKHMTAITMMIPTTGTSHRSVRSSVGARVRSLRRGRASPLVILHGVRAAAKDPAPPEVTGTEEERARMPLGTPSAHNSRPARSRATPFWGRSSQRRAAGRQAKKGAGRQAKKGIAAPPRSKPLLAGFALRRRITMASNSGKSHSRSTIASVIGEARAPSPSVALPDWGRSD